MKLFLLLCFSTITCFGQSFAMTPEQASAQINFWKGYLAGYDLATGPYILRPVKIGAYNYRIDYSADTLGKTVYPYDDVVAERYIVLPTMESQIPVSWEHEKIHACLHNHPHNYKSRTELEVDLNQTYTEEQITTILAPCLLALESINLQREDHNERTSK
jgi:hypothetical protein